MAASNSRQTVNRRAPGRADSRRNTVVYGNTARRLEEAPVYRPPVRRPAPAPVRQPQKRPAPVQVSEAAQRNRERAKGIGKGYVMFLACISVLILAICVHYLQLQTEITRKMKNIASIEAELTQVREDNDAYYSQVTSDVDLDEIKKIAIGRLGMRFPKDDQIMTYETEGRSYVRQLQDVPGTK